MRRILWLGIFVFVTLAVPISSAAQENQASVLWLLNGQMWLNATPLASEHVSDASLAPDAQHIAYTQQNEDQTLLGIYRVSDGMTVHQISHQDLPVTEQALQFSTPLWIDADSVVFQTYVLLQGPGGIQRMNDLWQLDIDGTLQKHRDAGQGGEIFLSPDRSKMILAQSGTYREDYYLARLEMLDTLFFEPIGEPFWYDAVSTGTVVGWLPSITWHENSESAAFFIPLPDLLYAEPQALPLSRHCIMTLGITTCENTIPVGFPAHGVWSSDLSQVAYQQPLARNTWEIVIHNVTETRIATDGFPEVLFWLDNKTLIIRETSTQAVTYFRVTNGVKSAWDMPILNIIHLPDGRIGLAMGSYEAFSVAIFDPETSQVQEIAQRENGFPHFGVH